MARGVSYLYTYAAAGNRFIFGELTTASGPWGMVFAVQILPLIIFFGSFMAFLFHIGLVQKIVGGVSRVVRPLLGTTGAETVCAIANSFLGQTESPLLIRHYLKSMTKSELLVVMVSGMGTISGAILVVFSSMGVPAEHLLASSVMCVPATIMIAKILLPETETHNQISTKVDEDTRTSNVFDALSSGASDGLQLALNVGAMLLAFIALMAMINGLLGGVSGYINCWFGVQLPTLSLDLIFSTLFYPFAYLLGCTGETAYQVAELLGTKVAVNEFLAYVKMQSMDLPLRVKVLTTYALCGFSNFSCIGIQVGGIGALVPEKRKWLTELGLKAVLGGALANLLTACMAGLFI
jgi:CNT family concentrative nucleoside transporter